MIGGFAKVIQSEQSIRSTLPIHFTDKNDDACDDHNLGTTAAILTKMFCLDDAAKVRQHLAQ